jgi:hypothetical protein
MTTLETSLARQYHIERIRVFDIPKQAADEGLVIGMSAVASEKLLKTGALQQHLGEMGYALFDLDAEVQRDDTYCDVQVGVRPPMSPEHLQALGHDIVSGALEASWSPNVIDVETEGIAVTDHRLRSPEHALDSGPYVIANSLQYVLQQQQKAQQEPQLRLVS